MEEEFWDVIAAYRDSDGWICATYASSTTGELDDVWYPPEAPTPEIAIALANTREWYPPWAQALDTTITRG
jgi:hypothetical protein